MLLKKQILASIFSKTLTLFLLISLSVQVLYISEPNKPLVLCIEDTGHIAIENPNDCVHGKNYDRHINGNETKSKENSSNGDDGSCFDIYLSLHELLHINSFSKIKDIFQTSIFHSNHTNIEFKESSKIISSINKPVFKILLEYSTVSLLL